MSAPGGCYPPVTSDNFNVTEYYVLDSIYAIWEWYNQLWLADTAATLIADLHTGEIIDTIRNDMPHDDSLPGDTSLEAILGLLTAGLAFVNFPGAQAGGLALSTALQQAPGLAKSLLATGQLGSKVTPLDQIESSLGGILAQFQINLANTLNETQSNYDAFISHAANGSFIGNAPSLNVTTPLITSLLRTYIVSQALQSHNIIITVGKNLNGHDLWQKTNQSRGNSAGP